MNKVFILIAVCLIAFKSYAAPNMFSALAKCDDKAKSVSVTLYTSEPDTGIGLVYLKQANSPAQVSTMQYKIDEDNPEGLSISNQAFGLSFVLFDDGGDHATMELDKKTIDVICKII